MALNASERRRSRKSRRRSREIAGYAPAAERRRSRRKSREVTKVAERRRSRRSHRKGREDATIRAFQLGLAASERRRSGRRSRRKSREVAKVTERRRSRRSREVAKVTERRRSRRSRPRSREILQAVNYGVSLAERRRSRRSRKSREAVSERRRSRRSRRSREATKVAERRRSRRSRRSREAASERRRSRKSRRSRRSRRSARRVGRRSARRSTARRSRRSRRSREATRAASERRRSRRSRRSREATRALAERRRTRRGVRPLFSERHRSYRRSREGYGASAIGYSGYGSGYSGYSGLAERARRYGRYAPRGREWFGSETVPGRYSNPDGGNGMAGKATRFTNEVLKPAGWGALGLVGARAVGELYGWVGSKVGLSKIPAGAQTFMPIGLAALSAGTVWYLAGRTRVGAKLTPEKKRYVNVGAGLLIVQELLALLLPKLGFLPTWAKRSLTGELPPALAGLPAIQQQQAALGNCFTGTCASALAAYGWQSPPCGLTPDQAAAWQAAQMAASQGRALQGDPGMGNCFTGACPGNPPGCTGSGPQCCGCPPQGPGAQWDPRFKPDYGAQVPPLPPPPPPPTPGAQAPTPGTTFVPQGPVTAGPTGCPAGQTRNAAGVCVPTIPPGVTVGPQSGWGMAGNIAVQRSGIADPVVQQILAGSCQKAEQLFAQVGLAI